MDTISKSCFRILNLTILAEDLSHSLLITLINYYFAVIWYMLYGICYMVATRSACE